MYLMYVFASTEIFFKQYKIYYRKENILNQEMFIYKNILALNQTRQINCTAEMFGTTVYLYTIHSDTLVNIFFVNNLNNLFENKLG